MLVPMCVCTCMRVYTCAYLGTQQHTPPEVHTPWNSRVSKKLHLGTLGRWGLWRPQLTTTAGRQLLSQLCTQKNTAGSKQRSGEHRHLWAPRVACFQSHHRGTCKNSRREWDIPTPTCMARLGYSHPPNLVHPDPLCASNGWEVSWEVESLSPEVPGLEAAKAAFPVRRTFSHIPPPAKHREPVTLALELCPWTWASVSPLRPCPADQNLLDKVSRVQMTSQSEEQDQRQE